MEPKKAVIYVRVSTDKQAVRGVSLDNQESACQNWAFNNGVVPQKLFREEGASAKTLKRPEFQKLIIYLTEHKQEIDYLIVYQIDRLSRDLADFVDLIGLLRKLGIELRDSSSQLEANDSDELLHNLNAVLAQHDNKVKSRRVLENMKRSANDGYRMHKAPYALKNTRNASNRPTVAPVQPTADKVARLLNEFSKGIYTQKDLIGLANEMGLKQLNGKQFSHQFVDKLLNQPLYAGLEKSTLTDGQLVDSTFEGIIPRWVYETNLQILASRRASKSGGYQWNHPEYPLRRFVRCADCNSPLRGSTSTGRGGKKYGRYHCTSKSCPKTWIKPDELRNDFEELLKQVKPSDERLKLLSIIVNRVWADEIATYRRRRDDMRLEIDNLEDLKLDVAEQYATGKLSEEEKQGLTNRYKSRLTELRNDLLKVERRIGTKQKAIDFCIDYIANAAHIWLKASPEWKQVYQRMIFPEGITYNLHKREFGTAQTSDLYRLASIKKETGKSLESTMVALRGIEPRLPE